MEWTETESTRRDDGTTEEHTIYFRGHERYFDIQFYLVGGSRKFALIRYLHN